MAKSKLASFAPDKSGPSPARSKDSPGESVRMNVYLSPEDAKRFKRLKVDTGTSGPDLVKEAFSLLFAKHKAP